MKHTPSYQLSILQEATFSEEMAAVAAQLADCRQEGTFCGFDGKELYYEYFQVQESRGAIVLVHGLSEFTGKYHEFAWYLLNQGYDVFLYDQRGHGRSAEAGDAVGSFGESDGWELALQDLRAQAEAFRAEVAACSVQIGELIARHNNKNAGVRLGELIDFSKKEG